MNKLSATEQKAFNTLLSQLDHSVAAETFRLNAHESLLEQPAVALQLIDILLASTGVLTTEQQEHRGMLLHYSLKLCLSHDELGRHGAVELQQMIEQQLSQYLNTQNPPDFLVLRALINILFRVEILISDDLQEQINQAEYPQAMGSAELSEQLLHEQLAAIAKESQDASLYELTEFLFEQFSQLPPEIVPIIATMLLQAADEKLRYCATLFLLHPHPLFRKALLDALPSLAQQRLLRSTDLQRLVRLRNWLQKDAHPVLDRCIKLLQRQQLPAEPDVEAVTISAVSATPIDNSGAMMLLVELKQARHFLLFSFMFKQGQGIKDAFITPPLTRKSLNEIKSNIHGEMPVATIDKDVLVALLEHFLLKSREQNRLPLALFLFRELTADVWGSPHAITEELVINALIGQKNRTNKLDVVEFLAGWAKPSNLFKQDLASYIHTQMEPMRELWRERFLVTALVFAKTANDMPQLLQAALDIGAGRPLAEIDPICVIAIHSLAPSQNTDDLLQQLLGLNGLDLHDFKQGMADGVDGIPDSFDLGLPELDPTKRIKRAVYLLKIQLKGSKPLIHRTLQVMNTVSLESLHEILQIAMGWKMEHSYEFKNAELSFVPPWFEFTDGAFYSRDGQLRDLLKNQDDQMTYVYDFGDWWEHQITLEKVLPAGRSNVPTQLLKAKGACPPEDIGGIDFFNQLREVLTDPTHQEHKKLCRKYQVKSGKWDPDFVDINVINQWLLPE
jgi:hypothetical protein